MAGIKLYPPTISGSLPAFYSDGGTARIAVPFSMNKAVNSSEIKGLSLKIKTVQSNTFICDLQTIGNVQTMIANKVAIFDWVNINDNSSNMKKVTIGQFLKVQMAYIDQNSNPGYYSTVGIIKYTAKPQIFIEGLGEDPNRIDAFRSSYTGVYQPGEDKSERPYSYKFSLYDQNMNLIESSNWLLHNTTINNVASESLSLEATTDTFSFNTTVNPDNTYYLQYSVRTINNLEVNSSLYPCLEPSVGVSDLNATLYASNVFEEGYINVQFVPADGLVSIDPISIEICRSEKTDNFQTWRTLQRLYFSDYEVLKNWNFRDFTVEQGVTYKYCFRQYNENNIYSDKVISNSVIADFEDMFLWDGEKQLKIRFNPKVSSFKINRFEQKTDTIGNKFPFIFRNGQVEYKEFPISGLISYHLDNNELFINAKEDLNILLGKYPTRLSSPVNQNSYDTIDINNEENSKSWEITETLDSVGYNMRAERRFKLKLLDWLGNGQIKLFRSPAEGNYFVRLLNISLTPEDKLSRMLHTFSCTAYEVADFTYNNLLDLGFLTPRDTINTESGIRTINLANWISQNITSKDQLNEPIQINTDSISWEIIVDQASGLPNENSFYIRVGPSETGKTLIVAYNGGFTINTQNTSSHLLDIYFCPADNFDFIQNYNDSNDLTTIKNQLQSLVGDSQITYRYDKSNVVYGEFQQLEDVYLTNKVEMIIGDAIKDFMNIPNKTVYLQNKHIYVTEQYEVLKIFALNFKEKQIRNIIKDGNTYKDEDNTIISSFDDFSLYHITELNGEENEEYYCCSKNGILQNVHYDSFDSSVKITAKDNEKSISFKKAPPSLNLPNKIYKTIELGNGVYLECVYQVKITQKKQNS